MSENSETSLSMLQGMRNSDPRQWDRFVQLFGPLVYEWCRRRSISDHDSADIVQEVFRAVAKQIRQFRKQQPSDTFRGWLRRITQHKMADHFRSVARQPLAQGGSDAKLQFQMLAFDAEATTDENAEAYALYLRALELLQTNFETRTWQAFWKSTIDDMNAASVAAELKMSVGSVYNAKYKVLRALRREFGELL